MTKIGLFNNIEDFNDIFNLIEEFSDDLKQDNKASLKKYEETNGPLKLRLNLPGIPKENISVKIIDKTIYVSFTDDGKTYNKSTIINDKYEIKKTEVKYKDGRLNIEIPEKDVPKNEEIKIKIN